MEIVIKKCECGCGENVSEKRRYVSGHNLKRRPKDALVINGRLHKEYTCERCNDKYTRRADHSNSSSKNHCKDCAHIHQGEMARGRVLESLRNGKEISCELCKRGFYVSGSRLKRNAKYCSRECSNEAQRINGTVPKGFISSANNKGENNGMYKHGKRTGANATGKRKLRKKVIARDGGDRCTICKTPGPGLHLHRVIYGSQGGGYELGNCVQLCAKDHEEVHADPEKWTPYLKNYMNEMGKFR